MIIAYITLTTIITACQAFNETYPYMFRAKLSNFWFKPADYDPDYYDSTLHLCIGPEKDPEGQRFPTSLLHDEPDCQFLSHTQEITFLERTNITAVSFSRWPEVPVRLTFYIKGSKPIFRTNRFVVGMSEITLKHNTSIDCEERNKYYELEGIFEADCDNIVERPFCGFGEGDERDFIAEMSEVRSDKDPNMFTFSSLFLVLSCILAVLLFVLFVMGTQTQLMLD